MRDIGDVGVDLPVPASTIFSSCLTYAIAGILLLFYYAVKDVLKDRTEWDSWTIL